MQYFNNRLLFLTILCLFIFIDETNSFRVRIPALRLLATFSKPNASIKKTNYKKMPVLDVASTLKDRSSMKINEL